MRTTFKTGLLSLLALFAASSYVQAQGYVLHDLSTGIINGTTTPIAVGTADDTWKIALPANPTVFGNPPVCTTVPAWDIKSCARWITNKVTIGTGGGAPHPTPPVGTYRYKTTFNVSSLCFPWVKANFAYVGSDDNVTGFYLNGNAYTLNPPSANDFNILPSNITINLNPAHFVIGTNEIVITTNNIGSVTGFYVCGNVTAGYCPFSGKGMRKATADVSHVYPNPSDGRFTVTLNDPAEGSIEVTDLMGRRLQQLQLLQGVTSYPIDLSTVTKGIYMVSVRTQDGVQTHKITLQ